MMHRATPILTVDLVEERFRFTASLTHGAASLGRLARAMPSRPGRRDPFGQVMMERAPHLAEQPGSIKRRRFGNGRQVYIEPIRLALR